MAKNVYKKYISLIVFFLQIITLLRPFQSSLCIYDNSTILFENDDAQVVELNWSDAHNSIHDHSNIFPTLHNNNKSLY